VPLEHIRGSEDPDATLYRQLEQYVLDHYCNQTCVELKISNLTSLQQAVVFASSLRREYKRRPIRVILVDITVKRQMEDRVVAQR
jgi:hypothetical protein